MRALRRFLLTSLLTGLVIGCQSKSPPGRSEDTPPPADTRPSAVTRPSRAPEPSESLKKKIKKAQAEPEGPNLRP
jgi:hypothetical protein